MRINLSELSLQDTARKLTVESNPRSQAFWEKNGLEETGIENGIETGAETGNGGYTVAKIKKI